MNNARLNDLERYTISGNEVPVERITIPAQDLRDLIAAYRDLDKRFEAMWQDYRWTGKT